MSFRFELTENGQVAVIDGEIDAIGAAAFAAALAGLVGEGPVLLELRDLELLDGVSVAETVNGVRALAARRGQVTLRHAPQMLAHTLYKRGLLLQEPLSLVDPRHDEGYGSS